MIGSRSVDDEVGRLPVATGQTLTCGACYSGEPPSSSVSSFVCKYENRTRARNETREREKDVSTVLF